MMIVVITTMTTLLFAQKNRPWQVYLEGLNGTEDFESTNWEQYEELLSDLAEHPININTATREDLEQLPFLNAQQIEDIQAYVYQYGPMKSMGEIAMIESIGWYQRKLLEYFTYAGDVKEKTFPSLNEIAKYGKHEIVLSANIPFYERKGDKSGYLGYKYKHWLRYQFNYSDFIKLGFLGSQDAGEPFFANRNSAGYDFYSFYFQIRKLGRLKNLTIGRYRLGFGMGLVLNNDLSFGKTATLSTLGRNSNAIRVHSSRSAANYLQGAASTITIAKGLDLSAFLSYRKIDATLRKGGDSIQTIVKTGYHRTKDELEKKNNSSQMLAGANLNYFKNGFHAGFTYLYTSLDKYLAPRKTQIYKQYAAEGKNFWNAGVNYGYISRRLNFSGETATGSCKAIATINSLSYLLTDELSFIALQRFYSYKYYSLFSSSFCDGGSIQDESGIYIGANWNPTRQLTLRAYADYAYFAWPKYGTSRTSQGWDSFLSAAFHLHRWELLASYRYKMKQKDNKEKTALLNNNTQRGRLSASYAVDCFSSKTQLDIAYSSTDRNSLGYMASEVLKYQKSGLQICATFGYFHTDDYSSRVYTYEPGLLYNISFPSFYGEGIRYTVSGRADFGKHFMLITKLGTTDYFDRNHISSSYQQIDRSSKTDLELQLRIKL